MAAAPKLMAVSWKSDDGDRYTLTSRGKLFVEYAVTQQAEAWLSRQEVELKTLSLKTVYQELSRHIPPQEEPEP